MSSIQLSKAIDLGMATLGHNTRPEGWREAHFDGLLAWAAPECSELIGELPAPAQYLNVAVSWRGNVFAHPCDGSRAAHDAAVARGDSPYQHLYEGDDVAEVIKGLQEE